jgi:osmoprotectant transport system permease protein
MIYERTWSWLTAASTWQGPQGMGVRTGIYLWDCLLTLLLALAIALPLGLWIGHTGHLRQVVVAFTGGMRALPTLGLLTALSLWMGLGLGAPLLALTVLAIPPILAGAYSGVESVDPRIVDACHAMGMTGWQTFRMAELPLAAPLIVSGLRSAAVQIVATWTVAAYLPIEGLGRYLIDGLAVHNYPEMLGGSLVIIVIELVVDGLFALLERAVVARGVRLERGMAGATSSRAQ